MSPETRDKIVESLEEKYKALSELSTKLRFRAILYFRNHFSTLFTIMYFNIIFSRFEIKY